MAERKPFSFIVTVGALAIAGAVLYYSVQQLPREVGGDSGAVVSGVSLHQLAEAGKAEDLAAQIKSSTSGLNTGLESGPLWQRGMTPLMAAIAANQEKAIDVLLAAKPAIESRSRDGRTALIWAAGWSTPAVVQKLLDAGAEKNARDESNWNALMMAAGRGDIESLRILIRSGADINAKNKWGQTALMTAIRAGSIEKISALLEAGANPNDSDLDGLTPLHMAAEGDAPLGATELLHKRGGRIDAQSVAGLTPLMIAADRGNLDKVKMLISLGAKPSPKDSNGSTALDWARQRGDDAGRAIVEFLESQK